MGIDLTNIENLSLAAIEATLLKRSEIRLNNSLDTSMLAGIVKALSNMAVLTIRINTANIDMLVLLQPTLSTDLYVQILGRHTRLAEGQQNCLVLDYAGDIKRHGSVDVIDVDAKNSKDASWLELKDIADKLWPNWQSVATLAAYNCNCCAQFLEIYKQCNLTSSSETKHAVLNQVTSKAEIMKISSFDAFICNSSSDKPSSLLLEFTNFSSLELISQWLSFESSGYSKTKDYEACRVLGGCKNFISSSQAGVESRAEVSATAAILFNHQGRFLNIMSYKGGGACVILLLR